MKSYGGTGVEQARDIVQTSDGNFMLLVMMDSNADGDITEHFGGSDIWLVKIDEN